LIFLKIANQYNAEEDGKSSPSHKPLIKTFKEMGNTFHSRALLANTTQRYGKYSPLSASMVKCPS
jgi:hypothetical protein